MISVCQPADVEREVRARDRRSAQRPSEFGFGFGAKASPGGFLLDVSTLNLTAWFKSAFSASPWTGSASAGTSGSISATEATNPPAVGTSLGGLASPDFDGTNDRLVIGTNPLSNAAGSIWLLVFIDTISSNTAGTSGNCIVSNAGGQWGIYLRSNTGSPVVGLSLGTTGTSEASISTGAWQLVQAKWDGTNRSIRVNSGARTTNTGGTFSTNSANTILGSNTGGTIFYDGRIRECGVSQSAVSDATDDDIKNAINVAYGLSL